MDEAESSHASLEVAKSLHWFDGVVMPGPHRHPALTESFGNIGSAQTLHLQGEGRHPAAHRAESHDPHPFRQSFEETPTQEGLVGRDLAKGRLEGASAI